MSSARRCKLQPAVRKALIESTLPMVRRLARQLCSRLSRGNYDDLVQAGSEGLVEAAETYDPAQNDSFQRFAWARVRGEMLDRYHREQIPVLESWLAGMRRAGADVAEAVHDEGDVLTDTDEMTQDRLDSAVGSVATAMAFAFCDRAAHASSEESFIVREDYLRAMVKLHEVTACLSEHDALILNLRWQQGLDFEQIAEAVGVSCPTAHRHYALAFKRLGDLLRARGITRAPAIEGSSEEIIS